MTLNSRAGICRPPKVMLIIAARSVTGPAKGVFQFLEHVGKNDADCILYAFSSNGIPPTRFLQGARQKGISVILLNQRGISYISLVFQTIREARRNNITIIQTHGFKPTVLGFFAHIFCRIPWICFMHGTTSENTKVKFYNFIDNTLQQFATLTVLVSEAQRNKIFQGRDKDRVRVLHNAIDIEHPMPVSPDRQPVRQLLDLPADSKLLVVVGRFSPEKGVDVFLDAVSRLSMEENSIHAVLVGDGQERESLQELAESLGIAKNVHFAGFTKTPGDYVIDADVVVVPSRSEGIPNAVLEAMAMGKPVVATSVGGIPEIIEDRVSGWLVPPEQPQLLADAIMAVLNDFSLYSRFAVNGKKRMQQSFSINKRVNTLLAIYREVLDEPC